MVRNEQSAGGTKRSFRKLEPFILYLGLLAFLAMVCEGGMFDWSGIYFQKVDGEEIFSAGYLILMVFMASSQFTFDLLIAKVWFACHVLVIITSGFILGNKHSYT